MRFVIAAAVAALALLAAGCTEFGDGPAPSFTEAAAGAARACTELEAAEATGAADALAEGVAEEELELFREARRDLCARARAGAALAPFADALAPFADALAPFADALGGRIARGIEPAPGR